MSPDAVLWTLKLLFSGAAIFVVVAYHFRPLWKMLRAKPDIELLTPEFSASLEGEELQIPDGMEEKPKDRGQLVQEARSDPQAVALMVQRWLKERK